MNMFNEQVQSTGYQAKQIQPGQSKPREVQRQATERAVLDAAERLFHSKGFKATTVRGIAAEAGVSIGTVMAAGDKDSLLVSAMDRRIALMHRDRLLPDTGFLAMKAGNNAPEMIAALVQPFLQLFASDLELAREYGAILIKGKHASGVFGRLALQLKAEFEQVFRLFGLRGEAASNAATSVHLAYLGILLAWAGGAFDQHSALDQLQSVAATAMQRGGA